jgi:hypothetical protein
MPDEDLRRIEERLKRNREVLSRTRKVMTDLENVGKPKDGSSNRSGR